MAGASLEAMVRRERSLLYRYSPTHSTWDDGDKPHPPRGDALRAIEVARALADNLGVDRDYPCQTGVVAVWAEWPPI